MAVFRVEKNSNYTSMSNYHLRDTTMTLKAIELLSKILSLPDDWDYSVRGLVAICKEGKDCIVAVLQELEEHGYLERRQLRRSDGKMGGTEYVIFEQPHKKQPCVEFPCTENPDTGKPDEEYAKLRSEFPGDYEQRIERLSEYMASTGKSNKSHLATIRSWARRDSGRKTAYGAANYQFKEGDSL